MKKSKLIGILLIFLGVVTSIGITISILSTGNFFGIKRLFFGLISVLIGYLFFTEKNDKKTVADIDERNHHLLAKADSTIVKIITIFSAVSAIVSIIILQFYSNQLIFYFFISSISLFTFSTLMKIGLYFYNNYKY